MRLPLFVFQKGNLYSLPKMRREAFVLCLDSCLSVSGFTHNGRDNTMKQLRNITVLAAIIALVLSAQTTSAQNLKWKMKSVKATWKESRLTGAVSSYKEKGVLTTVGVQVYKMSMEGADNCICFRRTQMKKEDDGDYNPFLGGFPITDKEKLMNALKTYSDKMSKLPAQNEGDSFETIYESEKIGDFSFSITYAVRNKKKSIEVVFKKGEDDTTEFVLDKVDIDQLRSKISQIK